MNFKLFLFQLLLICYSCKSLREIQCRDPDVGGTAQNKDRKFMILGSDNGGGAGMGNLMIFYPAAFYFAAFTGRDIIISDKSIFGELCSIINCGYPFVSQLSLAFPKLLNNETLRRVEEAKAIDFHSHIEEKKNIDSVVIRASGYQPKSDWWVYYNTTAHCVKKLTGCDLGDVMCSERHAYQRLIRGPFKNKLSEEEETRILGVPDNIKHAILTLPHAYAPRLDVAVHLRAQFNHFESHADVDDPQYRQEVDTWLAGEECANVFKLMADKVESTYKEIRPDGTTNDDPVYIYLASDNKDVKDRFVEYLKQRKELFEKIQIMRVESKSIYHVKQLARMKSKTENEGLLDLVFDWYALSLANTILAWRKGGTGMISTFVHSAQKVSGTTDRSDNGSGRGIGTRGLQLKNTRRGLQFELFWAYTFLEDYQ